MIGALFIAYFENFSFTYHQTEKMERIKLRLGSQFDYQRATQIIRERGQALSFVLEVVLEKFDGYYPYEPDIMMEICEGQNLTKGNDIEYHAIRVNFLVHYLGMRLGYCFDFFELNGVSK
jgi:hypothetical protein